MVGIAATVVMMSTVTITTVPISMVPRIIAGAYVDGGTITVVIRIIWGRIIISVIARSIISAVIRAAKSNHYAHMNASTSLTCKASHGEKRDYQQ